MTPEEQLECMYDLVDSAAEKFLIKKKIYDTENNIKKKFIPGNVRKLLRKKLKLSKKKLSSKDWRVNHNIMEKLDDIDNEISIEYKKKRKIEKERALN